MFQSVLAVLLFGMMPVASSGPVSNLDAALLQVNSPSPSVGGLTSNSVTACAKWADSSSSGLNGMRRVELIISFVGEVADRVILAAANSLLAWKMI
jgi:hypothetical protein